jgi:hypothetical protein
MGQFLKKRSADFWKIPNHPHSQKHQKLIQKEIPQKKISLRKTNTSLTIKKL